MVKNLPSSAGDVSLIPGQEIKIPHSAGQLSPCAATTEPASSRDCVPQLESPCAATTEPVHSGMERKILHAATKILCATTKT